MSLAPPPDNRWGCAHWGCAHWGCAALVGLVLGAIFLPVFSGPPRSPTSAISCLSNTKQLAAAMQLYAQDYDGLLPPANHWHDGTVSYFTRNEGVYVCPKRPELRTGYAFNSLLGGQASKMVLDPEKTPLIFESSLGQRNGADLLQSFVMPHEKRGSVGFADGHARLLKSAPSAADGLRESVPLYKQRDAAP